MTSVGYNPDDRTERGEGACGGPDLDAIVAAVKSYGGAGFTDIALIRVGADSQDRFLAEADEPLLAEIG